jgi:4-amino-4-deoxy-L-arabinose transferase-like glycosyltransferase
MLRFTWDIGLLGYDTYPIIVSSQIHSLADAVGNFTEKLMDGRYRGDFYRPLLNWSFALDHTLYGLQSWGYQVSNALLFGCTAATLALLAGTLLGPGSRLAQAVTFAFFLLFPAHLEVVPVAARRPEFLCLLFMTLALLAQIRPVQRATERPPLLPAVFTLLALTAKETALLLPVVCCTWAWLFSTLTGAARWRQALFAAVPHLVVVALLLAARWLVLGGMGGHEDTDPTGVLGRLPRALQLVGAGLLGPQPVMRSGILFFLGGTLLTTGLAALLWSRHSTTLRAGLAALLWFLVLLVTYSPTGRFQPWYLPVLAAPTSLLLAALGHACTHLWGRRGPARLLPASFGLVLLVLLGWHASYSPLLRSYPGYQQGTAACTEFFDKLAPRLQRAAPGSVVWAPPLPRWIKIEPQRPTIFGGALLDLYTVKAWADLRFPALNTRVIYHPGSQPPRIPEGEVVVGIRLLRKGFEEPPRRSQGQLNPDE